jgi:hypothetical protein
LVIIWLKRWSARLLIELPLDGAPVIGVGDGLGVGVGVGTGVGVGVGDGVAVGVGVGVDVQFDDADSVSGFVQFGVGLCA